jgi:hypothetical protein
MTTLNYYRIYCETENQWKYNWSESEPTICPNISYHSVNSNSVSIEDTVSSSIVKIKEERITTGGFYSSMGIVFDINTTINSITESDVSFKHPVNILTVGFTPNESNFNDEITGIIAPNTTIGYITSNSYIGESHINVSQTVIDNIYIGFSCYLTDGTNSSGCGVVTNIDKELNSISFGTPLNNSYSLYSPTYVQMSIHMLNKFSIGPNHNYKLGQASIGASYIPTGTIGRICYKNVTGGPKKCYFNFEYLY